MRYQIANIILDVQGQPPVLDSPRWAAFQADSALAAEYTVLRRYVDSLPDLPNGRYYYDSVWARNYAVTQENEDTLYIDVLRTTHPWGTQVQHLYEELCMPHILLHKQKLLLHASYIETEHGAILFTAPSGTGKSTQAELWKTHRGAQIINGDRAVLGMETVPTAYGYPMSGSSNDCRNRTLPLRALVCLQQAPENTIRRLQGRELLRTILNGTYQDPKHPEDFARNIETALLFAQAPVFELACLPDLGAVETLENALLQYENGGSA